MAENENGEVEKSLLEKIQDLLERKPETYDVIFCVGKQKIIVRALKVILKASSPFLDKEFEENWELAVTADGEGIPLPDFDPIAFKLFVRLTSLDGWSLEILKTGNLGPNQILNLLSICRRFEMKKAVENLEILTTTVMQSFGEFKGTDDFLQLSKENLKYVLSSDNIGIKELEVFHCALRWADFQCKEMKVQSTVENIRAVLGDCIFEIRFPIMSCCEFTEATGSKDILTAEETLGVYKFIGLVASKRLEFDKKTLPFKTVRRKIPPGNDWMNYPDNQNEATSGLTMEMLRILDKELGTQKTVKRVDVKQKWTAMCLDTSYVDELITIGGLTGDTFEWNLLVGLAAGTLAKDLPETMKVVCKVLTTQPDGAEPYIDFQTWWKIYEFMVDIDGKISMAQVNLVRSYLAGISGGNQGMIGPRDFLPQDCPHLQ